MSESGRQSFTDKAESYLKVIDLNSLFCWSLLIKLFI